MRFQMFSLPLEKNAHSLVVGRGARVSRGAQGAPSGLSRPRLAHPGPSWPLLAPPGGPKKAPNMSWCPLALPGSSWPTWTPPSALRSWLLLASPGSSWPLLDEPAEAMEPGGHPGGASWILLAPPGSTWASWLLRGASEAPGSSDNPFFCRRGQRQEERERREGQGSF